MIYRIVLNDIGYWSEDEIVWTQIYPQGAWLNDATFPVGWDERDAKGV